jgi:protein-S-isoprenylcysteine O-methyltransferase Ste14
MLPEIVVAAFLASSLAVFLFRSLYERRKSGHYRTETTNEESEPVTKDPLVVVGAVFALVFYIEVVAYLVFNLSGFQLFLTSGCLQIRFPFDSTVQVLGMVAMVLGYALVLWSLRVLEHDKLVTWGPYGWLRHPQYVSYLSVFAGFFLLLLNLVTLLPLLATVGEIRMANIEEDYLGRRYGQAYVQYQQRTGKFFPKLKRKLRQ